MELVFRGGRIGGRLFSALRLCTQHTTRSLRYHSETYNGVGSPSLSQQPYTQVYHLVRSLVASVGRLCCVRGGR
jgi:hypothetical protein